MSNDLQKFIGVGIGIVGVIAAAKSFSSQLDSAEKKGVGLVSGLLLVAAGVTLVTRLENTVEDARQLIA